jgi:hypothetical protein
MATQIPATTPITVLEKIARGHIRYTLTHWTDTLEPEGASGSVFEMGGVTFHCDGNDDLDVAGAWGGIGNSTLVYIYYAVSGTTATGKLSTTAPTWSTTKQDWYNAAETELCIGSIFKDAAGNYTQKTLFLDREHGITYTGTNLGGNAANGDRTLRLATDASILWDESEDEFVPSKNLYPQNGLQLDKTSTNGSQAIGTSAGWTPPAGFYTFGFTDPGTVSTLRFEVYIAGGWRLSLQYVGGSFVYCDGANMRIWNYSVSGASVVYWIKYTNIT